LRKILHVLKNEDEVIPKLGTSCDNEGLGIVALSELSWLSEELREIIGLLVMRVGQLYI
jgi:hypothetical protein